MKAEHIINSIRKSDFIQRHLMTEFPSKTGNVYETMKILYEKELPLRNEKDLVISKDKKLPYLKKSTKRVDLAVFCQISDRKYAGYYPTLGFEVKVSKSDLIGDDKFHRYLPYFDWFWFAVPFELSDTAVSRFEYMNEIGILGIDTDGKVVNVKAPEKLSKPTNRDTKHLLYSFLKRQL